jgi:hypothetical protein
MADPGSRVIDDPKSGASCEHADFGEPSQMDEVAPNGEVSCVFPEDQGGRKEAGKSGERLLFPFLALLYCQMKQEKSKTGARTWPDAVGRPALAAQAIDI